MSDTLFIILGLWVAGSLIVTLIAGHQTGSRKSDLTDNELAYVVVLVTLWPVIIALMFLVIPFILVFSLGRLMSK